MKILVINGPNINLLGYREVDIYGKETYLDLVNYIKDISLSTNAAIKVVQTNSEGKIIDYLHEAFFKKYDGIVINPGAYTHYSYAILDAIKSIDIPVVEVHLSDITIREEFRKKSVIREACIDSIIGKHFLGYKEAIECLISKKKSE